MPEISDIRAWREAALQDGWTIQPLYRACDIEYSAEMTKQGFKAFIIGDSITIWGPDGLLIGNVHPEPYSWAAIVAGLDTCNECGARGKTIRVGFAHRVCQECRDRFAPEVEYRGWTA